MMPAGLLEEDCRPMHRQVWQLMMQQQYGIDTD
jgi:hypothetical protein